MGEILPETREKLKQLLYPREVFESWADMSWGVEKESGKRESDALIFTREMAVLYRKDSYSGREQVLEMYYTDVDECYQIVMGKEGSRVVTDGSMTATTRIETPLSYLSFGVMWTVTCFSKIPLTAHYSMNGYNGEDALQNPLFMKTNWILTLMWGILYLLTPIWTYFIMGTKIKSYIGAVNSILPILMGIFTVWFEKWYPAKIARGK